MLFVADKPKNTHQPAQMAKEAITIHYRLCARTINHHRLTLYPYRKIFVKKSLFGRK